MTVLFDGIAAGLLLFLISVGLSVTLGLMNFVNLAHGSFAMLGGYVCVVLLNRYGVPFLWTLPIAVAASAAAGVVLERTLYRRLYRASPLDQVLFSIGLVFMSIAVASYFFGARQQPLQLPDFLRGQFHFARRRHRRLPAVPGRHRPRASRSRCSGWSARPASAPSCAPRSTTRASRAASASTSTASSAWRSRSARRWPGSAARSVSTCSGSIRSSRSATSSTS